MWLLTHETSTTDIVIFAIFTSIGTQYFNNIHPRYLLPLFFIFSFLSFTLSFLVKLTDNPKYTQNGSMISVREYIARCLLVSINIFSSTGPFSKYISFNNSTFSFDGKSFPITLYLNISLHMNANNRVYRLVPS